MLLDVPSLFFHFMPADLEHRRKKKKQQSCWLNSTSEMNANNEFSGHDLQNEFWSARGAVLKKTPDEAVLQAPAASGRAGPKAAAAPLSLQRALFHALVQLDVPQLQKQPALLVHHPQLAGLHRSQVCGP